MIYENGRPRYPQSELKRESKISSPGEEDQTDFLLGAVPNLPHSPALSTAPTQRWFKSSWALSLCSLSLHSALVVIHIYLVIVWRGNLESALTFPISDQKIISLMITVASTTFITIYSVMLVFVMQTLAMRQNLRRVQPLTTAHDTAAAWSGMGSALFHLWMQDIGRASWAGVLSALFYLANILLLHITTPALFSLEAFNATQLIPVVAQSLPAFNLSATNLSGDHAWLDAMDYAQSSLYFLPSVLGSPESLGLHDGTLYDVIPPNIGIGNAEVQATGINITCGYRTPQLSLSYVASNQTWTGFLDDGFDFQIKVTQPGVIAAVSGPFNNTILLYSTIPIVDSDDNDVGAWVDLDPPMITGSTALSQIQMFQCSQTLVQQTALIDSQSRQLVTVRPNITKMSSTWLPFITPPVTGDQSSTLNGQTFMDSWAGWYLNFPPSNLPLHQLNGTFDLNSSLASVADVYMMQHLNLLVLDSSPRANVTLHEVENTLSIIVAAMFWTLGHGTPVAIWDFVDDMVYPVVPRNPSLLLQGEAIVTAGLTRTRLNLSIIAASIGLFTSVFLLLLSFQSLHFRNRRGPKETHVEGTGILHIIWLYRNHPDLETLLQQAEHPTDRNLREAGMVDTRLVGAGMHRRRMTPLESVVPPGRGLGSSI
ncbi:hypothetical protein C8R45DRAFT_992857 [Mycena sanguinolenta]|nr:hypothetical protein C8R45DRAFT_992857 [Mycena sanguinolenta]